MIKIAVLGHSPDAFSDVRTVAYDIEHAISLIQQQHGIEKDYRFLLNGNPGVSQWFCNVLIEKELPYEIYLTAPPEVLLPYWSEEQGNRFQEQLNKTRAVHVFGVQNDYQSCIKRDKIIVDESQWLLVFWNGKHQGLTYFALEYAMKTNKIVYNGISGLTLLSGSVLKVNKDERLQRC